tara:strand:- start:4848 stop:5285 length:438 start_codon:yes stop_codon:yes gene_type:complete
MTIYTDGSCRVSKEGAYGFITVVDDKINTCFARTKSRTTNNQMELLAFISALQYIKKVKIKNINVYSDSEYVVKGYTLWKAKWIKNGWKSKENKSIANQPLWFKIIQLEEDLTRLNACPNVQWVRAHGSNKYNNFIDNLVQNLTK